MLNRYHLAFKSLPTAAATTGTTSTLLVLALTACPQNTGDTFTEQTSSSTATGTTAAPTTTETSTGDATDTDTDTDATTEASTSTPTTGEPAACGVPAEECSIVKRDWCEELNSICTGAGLQPSNGVGTNYCEPVQRQCGNGETPCRTCFYIANTCKQLGGGEQACNDAYADCLCRATANGLDINN